MGRERTNPFRNFFVYNPANGTSTCTIGNCQRVMSGQHAANLERHVRYVHPEETHLVSRMADRDRAGPPPPDPAEPSGKRPRSRPSDLGAAKKPRCVPVKTTAARIRDACAELVTTNGRPFSLMEDSGFRKLLDPLLEALRGSLAVSAEGVRQSVGAAAAAARDLVRAELRGRLVCLELDGASRGGRSALGVHARHARDGALVLRTLAAREVTARDDLAAVALEVLGDYGVELADVYSVTTGGGGAPGDDAAAQGHDRPAAAAQEEDADAGSESEDAAEVAAESRELAERLELAALRLKELAGARSLLTGVPCAARELERAVADALEDASVAPLLSDARRVCRRLRARPAAAALRERGLSPPATERPAAAGRWPSAHDALEDLVGLSDFCRREAASDPGLALAPAPADDDASWRRLRDLLAALGPARACAETLRAGRLTAGDACGAWLRCRLDTEAAASEFAAPVARALRRRERRLLGNDAVAAAVYVDPRYGALLADPERDRARRHLRRAWAALEEREGREGRRQAGGSPGAPPPPRDESDELERLLRARERDSERGAGGSPGGPEPGGADVAAALLALGAEPRLGKDADVLAHWEGWRRSKPELFRLAQVALAVPVTQAGVERVFSALDFILSPDRFDLDGQTLEDILMVRLNEVFGR